MYAIRTVVRANAIISFERWPTSVDNVYSWPTTIVLGFDKLDRTNELKDLDETNMNLTARQFSQGKPNEEYTAAKIDIHRCRLVAIVEMFLDYGRKRVRQNDCGGSKTDKTQGHRLNQYDVSNNPAVTRLTGVFQLKVSKLYSNERSSILLVFRVPSDFVKSVYGFFAKNVLRPKR